MLIGQVELAAADHRPVIARIQNSGGGGPPEYPKKFFIVMAKRKSFGINERFVEEPFCQCHWEI